MLWRARATLADRPGSLADLAQRCGSHGVNILALQIFPGVDGVTDELVLRAPDGWALSDVAALVEAAGGTQVSVGACAEQALVDGPTRYLTAVRQLLHGSDPVPVVLARLLDALPGDSAVSAGRLRAVQDELVVGDGAERVAVRRTTPFTATEHARAAAFAAVAAELRAHGLLEAGAPSGPETVQPAVSGGPVVVRVGTLGDTAALREMHDRCSAETLLRHYGAPMARLDPRLARRLLLGGAGSLVAVGGGRVVGLAALGEVADGRCEASLVVEDGRQRQGVGTRLLGAAARLAAGQGAEDVVLRGPAESPAALAMVFGSGLRARAKLSGDELVVTVSARGLASLSAVDVAGERGPVPVLAPR